MLSPLNSCWLTAAAMLIVLRFAAGAQEWPSKQTVRVIVPFTAGSATDIVARTVFEQVGKQVGQTFVVENRGGGGHHARNRAWSPRPSRTDTRSS